MLRRKIMIVLIALGIAPGTFVRSDVMSTTDAPIDFILLEERAGIAGPLNVQAVWAISSTHRDFGGYSGLVAGGDGQFLAGSDRGRFLDFELDETTRRGTVNRIGYPPWRGVVYPFLLDLEALTSDPESGAVWAAFEHGNAIERIDPDGSSTRVKPDEMRRWSANSGPETLLRLVDGRFLVLGEAPEQSSGRRDRPGVLYAGDPVEGAEAIEFRYSSTPRYSPVDAAQVPGGDVVILERRVQYRLPAAEFDARLVRADPAAIKEGEPWSGEVLQTFKGSLFGENFEGLEFVPDPSNPDAGSLYMIADDNLSAFQRTLLVKLDWPAGGPLVGVDVKTAAEGKAKAALTPASDK